MTASNGHADLLIVGGLRRDYGGVRAVDDASFSVPEGRITGLIGPNGAGKSTVLGMIAGAIRPSAGSVVFDGTHIEGRPPYQLARQGLIRTFQIAGVFDRLTVMENMHVASPRGGGLGLFRRSGSSQEQRRAVWLKPAGAWLRVLFTNR